MKVQVSHRLDEGLLAWATEYAETRKSSRAVVIEEALRHFQGLAEGGVPDMPEPTPPSPRARTMQSGRDQQSVRSVLSERQRKLAREMGWGS